LKNEKRETKNREENQGMDIGNKGPREKGTEASTKKYPVSKRKSRGVRESKDDQRTARRTLGRLEKKIEHWGPSFNRSKERAKRKTRKNVKNKGHRKRQEEEKLNAKIPNS